ncbi:pyruvate formate-lyase-activating protein [Mobiluncus curtisii]|uniref:Pyruvate formate-lyase-activating enzyme n=2 Tax=Mobiluncus curtisii TaxID=2051 RepID=D6ZIR8_MOBCV|nr:pyruvate formate-lyase-activating protein [Mobiluncus curtisii]ADI66617.1 pyruvate formate-lyase 1-activating enzyme [Mobiluncus curtisii ATCC 43063]EFL93108.1 pyruvate formate-lyase 1-activating enzyme [Mobiluncus curtisii subsp. curtisii ATCC 35241]MCV0019876.1 pyruvate formate lyase-activating protein [Mobiluncus curtisii]NMW44188.1 pyruvate formate lyase-activating protein [Mobiluncus curtisii]NMW44991.1 pyruvate formate lyase-activating protein [Mobiluncus curtisii]
MNLTLERVRVDTIFGTEGSTGEYRPEPSEIEVPRVRGKGLDGIATAPEMDRSTHSKLVNAGELGSVHSWELVTAVDGPGTRLTIFLAGCPLRCVYCHNPDTWQMREGTPILAKDLLDKIVRYKAVYKATGGGVTFSGGEPMMQPRFLKKLLRDTKAEGIHTNIDTSGSLGFSFSDQELELLDLVMLDVKSGNPDTYQKVTGRPLQPTIDFGNRLAQAGIPAWIRFVAVPGWTDDADNVKRVADIVANWSNVERLEVLPFHQMGRDKWEELNLDYKLETVQPPDEKSIEQIRSIFRARGITVY